MCFNISSTRGLATADPGTNETSNCWAYFISRRFFAYALNDVPEGDVHKIRTSLRAKQAMCGGLWRSNLIL